MITLRQLIAVAPFPEDTKTELLSHVETLSSDKKRDLEELCWQFISQWYQNELRAKQETAVLEMNNGKKKYTKEDFQKIGDDLFTELTQKMDVQSSEEDLEQARENLNILLQEHSKN